MPMSKKATLSILIISFATILIVDLLVGFILSENDLALFIVGVSAMLLTSVIIIILVILMTIFLVRLSLKKKNCYGRLLSIISIIAMVMVLSTGIIIKEEGRYYHTINKNWKIDLPREYKEIYYKDSGPSFLGDGERYSVFQYETLDEINSAIEWENKGDGIEIHAENILRSLEVPKEYYPNYYYDLKYYNNQEEDSSQIYIILNSHLKRVYIVEDIL